MAISFESGAFFYAQPSKECRGSGSRPYSRGETGFAAIALEINFPRVATLFQVDQVIDPRENANIAHVNAMTARNRSKVGKPLESEPFFYIFVQTKIF